MNRFFCCVTTLLTIAGCGRDVPQATDTSPLPDVSGSTAETALAERDSGDDHHQKTSGTETPSAQFKPLTLSPTGSAAASATATGTDSTGPNVDVVSIIERLKPLQVMLGRWRGTTRREYDGFKAVDAHEWLWDLQTDPDRPALVLSSDKSPHMKSARITWDSAASQFLLTTTDHADVAREYAGDYTEPVREVIGEDEKLHRVFRLEFTQTNKSVSTTGPETWQLAFAQQENNRYLLEVAKRRGAAAFRRYDTVSTQRDGTSFALDDSSYGDKECIISQGLGTIAVQHKGRTYWVCCSGCKAAFEEDPETWIARAAARE